MSAYEDVLQQALCLTPEEQLKPAISLLTNAQPRLVGRRQHSISEFKGVGKELWQGIDVDQYLEEERNSWDNVKDYLNQERNS
jgi:hypothetical protein